MTLTARERRDLAKILDLLSEHLESAIETSVIPVSHFLTAPVDKSDARQVAQDRKDWRRVEDWKIRLTTKQAPRKSA